MGEVYARNRDDEMGDRGFNSPDSERRAKVLTLKDSRMRAEVYDDPIANVLEADARDIYLSELRVDTRQKLVNGLAATLRWGNGAQKVNPAFQEDDLDHVLELLVWANEIAANYPDLYKEICDGDRGNWLQMLSMIIGHDIGEIAVGDLCRSNSALQRSSVNLHKRTEAFAAKMMMKKELRPDIAQRHVENFSRFEKRDSHDKVVMLGHALDKGQAAQNVAKHIIPYNSGNVDYNVVAHWYNSQSMTFAYMNACMRHLRSRAAKQQLASFFEHKVLRYFRELDMEEINRAKNGNGGPANVCWDNGSVDI